MNPTEALIDGTPILPLFSPIEAAMIIQDVAHWPAGAEFKLHTDPSGTINAATVAEYGAGHYTGADLIRACINTLRHADDLLQWHGTGRRGRCPQPDVIVLR